MPWMNFSVLNSLIIGNKIVKHFRQMNLLNIYAKFVCALFLKLFRKNINI